MGPTPKQIAGIVLIIGSALFALPLNSGVWLLVCGVVSLIGLTLLVKGAKEV
jgi:hypothetical protein